MESERIPAMGHEEFMMHAVDRHEPDIVALHEFITAYMVKNPAVPIMPAKEWVEQLLRRAFLLGWDEASKELKHG